MIRRPPRSTPLYSSAASDVYKRQLREHSLPARIETEPFNVRESGDRGERDGVALLEFANARTREHERHVVEQNARDGKERPDWDLHAEAIEERKDDRQRDESGDDAERERQRDVRPLAEQRLVEQRRFGTLAVHGEEGDEG